MQTVQNYYDDGEVTAFGVKSSIMSLQELAGRAAARQLRGVGISRARLEKVTEGLNRGNFWGGTWGKGGTPLKEEIQKWMGKD